MAHPWEKILPLLSKQGDRFIVEHDQRHYVIMPLEQYSALVGEDNPSLHIGELNEDEMVEKINDDIAEWRSTQDLNKDYTPYFKENDADLDENNDDEDQYYLEPVD